MKVIGRYFVLKCKSCLKAFGKSAAGMCIVFVLLVTAIMAISFGFQQEQVLQKIKVGMVIPETETLIQKGMPFISAMDSIKSICEFYYMDEENARKELEEGDLQVVVILPVNFYADVYSGVNTPAEVLIAETEGINQQVFEELLTTGISYLQISEAGVYSVLNVAKQESTVMPRNKIGDFVAIEYVTQLFDRMDIYEDKVVSPLGIVDASEYLVIMILLCVLLLVGTDFSVLYQVQEKEVERKLKSEGINVFWLSLIKVFIMTICLWFIWVAGYTGCCIVSNVFELDILWWESMQLVYGFFLCLSVAAFYHFMYALAGGGMQSRILILFVNIGMLLCSGVIIPSSYLGTVVQRLGEWMPLSVWNEYVQRFMFGELTMELLVALFFVTSIEFIVGAVVTWKDM